MTVLFQVPAILPLQSPVLAQSPCEEIGEVNFVTGGIRCSG